MTNNPKNIYHGMQVINEILHVSSAGFRTNETRYQLSYEAPYLGPEGGRPGSPTQAVRHTCSGNLGIVKNFKLYHISKNPS